MDKSHSLKYYVKVIFSAYEILHKNDNSQHRKRNIRSFSISGGRFFSVFFCMANGKGTNRTNVCVFHFNRTSECCAKCQKCAPEDEHGSRRIMWNSSKRWICRHRYLRCDSLSLSRSRRKKILVHLWHRGQISYARNQLSNASLRSVSHKKASILINSGHFGNALNCFGDLYSTNCGWSQSQTKHNQWK